MNIFLEEHQEMIEALLKHEVRFMLVGGYAVIYHGYARTTGDMDIWLALGIENKEAMTKALRDFGIDDDGLSAFASLDFTRPQNVFYVGKEPRRIDFLTMISNVDFNEAYQRVVHLELGKIKVPVIHYNDLIRSKLTSSRLKDRADVEELERINKYRSRS